VGPPDIPAAGAAQHHHRRQNILAASADRRAEATDQDSNAVLHTSSEIEAHLAARDKEIDKILDRVTELGTT
jgi:hypothetical protein